jgi:squalene-hopene/tetraprenyl-beta-curcumene cyclase
MNTTTILKCSFPGPVEVVACCLFAAIIAMAGPAAAQTSSSWSPTAAAAYLDQRENWWMSWPAAARDHGTFCVSCHTAVPYALARATLPGAKAAPGLQELIDDVTKRVRLWNEVAPFYTDEKYGAHKSEQARGTEAVLNALILVSRDAASGRLSADARTALANMWVSQHPSGAGKGAWSWLQFNNEPWEAYDSQFYGASLAAVTVGLAPEGYRAAPAIRKNVELLRAYLNRECDGQSLINRAVLLWASASWSGLVAPDKQKSIVNDVLARQRADGGWSTAALVGTWKRADGTAQVETSDGYATGLFTLALERVGVPRAEPGLQRGLAWLEHNQNRSEGYWPASSLNRKLDPSYGPGRFMNDAATSYAVLALTASPAH